MNLVSRYRVRDPNVLASTASERPEKTYLKVRTYLWTRSMCSKQVRRDPYWAPAHQTTQNGTLTASGLLKCGNVVKCRTQVRRDPSLTSLSSMMIWTLTPPWNRTFLLDHDHSWTGWMIDCERSWTNLQKMQCKTLTNVLWFGKRLCLRHWKHQCSWERIAQTICIPPKNTGKISI